MIKKIVIVLVLVPLLVLPALAQTTFGLKGALSDYSFTGDGWDDVQDFYEFYYGVEVDNEFSFGFSVGGFLEHKFSNSLAIQPELLFTLATMQYGDGDDWIRESWKMLEVPVYLKGLFPMNHWGLCM
ncbi:outer membrane beta-barrel protein [Marispirochaeta sp.]|uniref:outer membrane beta-barrel protein n=1 Tax=Marispirochaeta sp. TaxID=2038653 RepID=UPI0029C80FF7|nr:outer membrane beta-barrel protein [Marispirochaeta sp.]